MYVIRYWDGERTRERSTGQEQIEAAEAVFEIWRANYDDKRGQLMSV